MTVVDVATTAASAPVVSAFDIAVLWLIAGILLLSLLSLCFIIHLCFKSRTSRHLRRFNSLWTVRSLLILFIALWSLSELLRLPVLRHRLHLRHHHHQALLCKLHVSLSLGFLEPAFLVTLLFLVDVSVKKDINGLSAVAATVIATCLPLLLLQILVLFFSSSSLELLGLPYKFWSSSSSVVSGDTSTVLCSYPLLSTAVFGSFAVGYSLMFLVSAWRVESLVINNALRVRIHSLVLAVLVSLPMQVVMLGTLMLLSPDDPAFGGFSLAAFLSAFACAVVGEGILVIKPIADSLSVWGHCCPWDPWRRQPSAAEKEEGRV